MVSDLNSGQDSYPENRAAASGYDLFGAGREHTAAGDSEVINGLLYNAGMLTGGKSLVVFLCGREK